MLRTALHLDLEPGSIPAKSGVMVLNVSTVAGIYQSVKFNLPVIKRNFTLTGDGIKFYIVPSFMGELNSNGARLMSKYLSEAADLVDILNKTRWESFMTKDYPD